MSVRAAKMQILSLYKSMLRESQKFSNYNFRSYAVRKVRDAFRENKTLTDPKAINKEVQFGIENLQLIRRQIIIGDMYRTDKLVIENVQ